LENKKKKEGKGITIYDVLLTNKKNKNEKWKIKKLNLFIY
jgi:hypothetical protein